MPIRTDSPLRLSLTNLTVVLMVLLPEHLALNLLIKSHGHARLQGAPSPINVPRRARQSGSKRTRQSELLIQHAPGCVQGLEDPYIVSETCQLTGGGQPARPGTDNRHLEAGAGRRWLRNAALLR